MSTGISFFSSFGADIPDISPLVFPIRKYEDITTVPSGFMGWQPSIDFALSPVPVTPLRLSTSIDFALAGTFLKPVGSMRLVTSIADIFATTFVPIGGGAVALSATIAIEWVNPHFTLGDFNFGPSIGFDLAGSSVLTARGALAMAASIGFGLSPRPVIGGFGGLSAGAASMAASASLSGGSTGTIDGGSSTVISSDYGQVVLYNDGNGNFYTI